MPQGKPKGKSPTARTLQELRECGYTAQVVERYNAFARVRQDLFGCIDIVAMPPANYRLDLIIGIQCCAGSSHAAHRDKIMLETRLVDWIRCGGSFELWSWSKAGKRGERKEWTKRVERFTISGTAVISVDNIEFCEKPDQAEEFELK